MNKKKLLSVIVPVYGTEKYIDICLKSALKASESIDSEIIVINDGTKDNAGKIAREYELKYPDKIIYFEKENGGLADTKNFGLKHARGEFVAFLDSDDYIEPEMYHEMLNMAQRENADCIICDMICDYPENGKSDYQKCSCNRGDDFYRLIDTPLMASSCNKVMKKGLLEGLEYPVGKNNEDIAVTPIAMGRSEKIAYIPKGFYHYVQRKGSIQNSSFDIKRFVILDVCRIALDRSEELTKNRVEMIKSALYVYQVLAVAFYLIKRQPFYKRYPLLKEYMCRVKKYFPDFYSNQEVRDYATWSNKKSNKCRKLSLWLLKHELYASCTFLWTVAQQLKID